MAAEPARCYRHSTEETRIRCTRCGRPICPDCMHPAPVGHHCPTCIAEAGRERRRPAAALRRLRRLTLTTTILGVNAAVFVVGLALGVALQRNVLVEMGAMQPLLIASGEVWRLLTPMVLHAGIVHLLVNSVALVVFGSMVESAYGTARFGAIYLVSGFVGAATSYAVGPPQRVSVGASGAIFGLLGAFLASNLRRRDLSMARGNVRSALVLIGINVAFGLTVPGIDNAAHLGGLAAGFLGGLALDRRGRGRAAVVGPILGMLAIVGGGVVLAAWRTAALVPAT